jgi:sugar phosphate permease
MNQIMLSVSVIKTPIAFTNGFILASRGVFNSIQTYSEKVGKVAAEKHRKYKVLVTSHSYGRVVPDGIEIVSKVATIERASREDLSKERVSDVDAAIGGLTEEMLFHAKIWIVYRCLIQIPLWTGLIYWPLFAKEVKSADQFTIGYIATTMMIMPLIFALPMGKLTDVVGRKRVLFVTTPLYCLSLLLFVHAQSQTMLIISAFFQGLLMLNAVTQRAMEVELVHSHFLERWLGITGAFRGIAAEVISPIVCGLIWSNLGPSYVFYFMIAVSLLGLAFLAMVPETLKIEEAKK